MNLIEFLFAFGAVFGFSGFWILWIRFVYNLEDKIIEKEAAEIAEVK